MHIDKDTHCIITYICIITRSRSEMCGVVWVHLTTAPPYNAYTCAQTYIQTHCIYPYTCTPTHTYRSRSARREMCAASSGFIWRPPPAYLLPMSRFRFRASFRKTITKIWEIVCLFVCSFFFFTYAYKVIKKTHTRTHTCTMHIRTWIQAHTQARAWINAQHEHARTCVHAQ